MTAWKNLKETEAHGLMICGRAGKDKPMKNKAAHFCLVAFVSTLAVCVCASADEQSFRAGYAEIDISPEKPMPMWGYGDRHAALSEGVRDPLSARVVVLDAQGTTLAVVGMDIGRAPTSWMMPNIRESVRSASDVEYVMIAGSHTHHGPVIELQDEEGKGKGKFDDAVAYSKELENKLIKVINEATENLQEARMGWACDQVDMNSNRHTKFKPKPVDKDLAVVRFDDIEGNPLVILVNFAAHPTNLPVKDLRFSSEYCGYMVRTVRDEMNADCVFMQGAAGDLSCNKTKETNTIEAFGTVLGKKVVSLAKSISTKRSEKPSIEVVEDEFRFKSRLDLTNPLLQSMFQAGFFPELISALDEIDGNMLIAPMMTALINDEVAIVTGPGEFFCSHSIRLKERCRAPLTLFFGYCNGHCMYFPTIEAAAEGGYGAGPLVSWVELGAGEQMTNKALINIYTLMGKYPSGLSAILGK